MDKIPNLGSQNSIPAVAWDAWFWLIVYNLYTNFRQLIMFLELNAAKGTTFNSKLVILAVAGSNRSYSNFEITMTQVLHHSSLIFFF